MRRGKATEHNSGFEFSGHLQELITLWVRAKSICRLFFADFERLAGLSRPIGKLPTRHERVHNLEFLII